MEVGGEGKTLPRVCIHTTAYIHEIFSVCVVSCSLDIRGDGISYSAAYTAIPRTQTTVMAPPQRSKHAAAVALRSNVVVTNSCEATWMS